MNCQSCRYELSQCLDGRLPSGRRAIVMGHVAECEPCGNYWHELQRAQELALQLPRLRVGPDFRNQLFARIEAGEGTPPAVWNEPVPAMTKVRYVLTGAMAAAAVLVVAVLLKQSGAGPELQDVASARPGALQPRSPAATDDGQRFDDPVAASPLLANAMPLTANLVAVEAAKQFQRRFQWTATNIGRVESGSDAFSVREVCDNAVELQGLAELLLELREGEHLTFQDQQVDVELRFFAQRLAADAARLREPSLDTVRLVVAPTLRSGPSLGELFKQVRVQPAVDPAEQMQSLLRLSKGRAEVIGRLFIVFPEAPPFEEFAPVFLLRNDCGANLVAPRSAVEEQEQFQRLQFRRIGPSRLRVGSDTVPVPGSPGRSGR